MKKNSQETKALVIVYSIARLLTCKLQWQSTHMCVRMLTVCVCVYASDNANVCVLVCAIMHATKHKIERGNS